MVGFIPPRAVDNLIVSASMGIFLNQCNDYQLDSKNLRASGLFVLLLKWHIDILFNLSMVKRVS